MVTFELGLEGCVGIFQKGEIYPDTLCALVKGGCHKWPNNILETLNFSVAIMDGVVGICFLIQI